MVWTVNRPEYMMEVRDLARIFSAALTQPRLSDGKSPRLSPMLQRRGSTCVLLCTVCLQLVHRYGDLKTAFVEDYDKTGAQYGRIFLWTTPKFYTPFLLAYTRKNQVYLERIAGPFDANLVPPAPVTPMVKVSA